MAEDELGLPPDPLELFAAETFPTLPADPAESSLPESSCSPTDTSSPDPSSPEGALPAAAEDAVAPDALEELLALIDWKGKNMAKGKRLRGSASESREKHIQREKQRRADSSVLIDEMDRLVPNPEPAVKRTKVVTLRDTVDYVRRVQGVALALLEENRRLSAALAQQPAFAPASVAPLSSAGAPTVGREDVSRLLVAGIFLFWVSLVPLPWPAPDGGGAGAFASRHILSVPALSSANTGLAYLWGIALRFLTVVASAACIWLVYIIREYSPVKPEKFAEVKRLFRCAEVAADRQSNWVVAQTRMNEAMELLNKRVPSTAVGEVLFLLLQAVRAFFHILVIGRWVERSLIKLFDRRDATIMESRMFLYSSRIGPLAPRLADLRPLRFCGCILAASCGLRAADAPRACLDELHSALCLFDDMRSSDGGPAHLLLRACIKLAMERLAPVEARFQPMDHCDWTLMRMTLTAPDQRLSDSLAEVMNEIPSLSGMPRTRAIATAGMICFVMRRYQDAFLLLSESVQLGVRQEHMPVYSTRMVTSTLILCARQLGRLDEARALLPALERLLVCVPDASANVLSAERLFLLCAQIACVGEHDFMALVTLASHLAALCHSLGVQRMFNLPFAIETVLERLLAALDLADALLLRRAADFTEAQAAVLHHRAEIHDLATSLLKVLGQYAAWADYVVPVIERARGWHACVSQRSGEALPHLQRSVSEARRLDLPLQEEHTRALMRRRGLWREEAEKGRAQEVLV